MDLPPEGTGIDTGCMSAGVDGSDRLFRSCLKELLLLLLASETPLMKRRGLSMLDQGVAVDFGPDAAVGLSCGEGDAVSGSWKRLGTGGLEIGISGGILSAWKCAELRVRRLGRRLK
jgi:hypothetical protein